MRAQRLLIMLGLGLSGCYSGSLTTFVTATDEPPARETAPELVVEGQPVPQRFQEVAIIQAKVYDADRDQALDALREEAMRLGCTIVVFVQTGVGEAGAAASGVCGTLEAR